MIKEKSDTSHFCEYHLPYIPFRIYVVNQEFDHYDDAVLELNDNYFLARKSQPKISQMFLILSKIQNRLALNKARLIL